MNGEPANGSADVGAGARCAAAGHRTATESGIEGGLTAEEEGPDEGHRLREASTPEVSGWDPWRRKIRDSRIVTV